MSESPTPGQTIRTQRLAKGLSLGQLASSVGRTASSVRRWEKDEAMPPDDVVDRLAEVLDVDRIDLEPVSEPDAPPGSPTTSTPVDSRYAMLSPDVDEETEAIAVPVASTSDGRETAIPEPEEDEDATKAVNPVLAWLGEFWDPEQRWRYYVRAGLTTVVLLLMVIILIWAMGALLRALGEFWDSIGSSEEVLGIVRSAL